MSGGEGVGRPGDRGGISGPTRTVYLAHPIDNGYFYARPVVDALVDAGHAVFDPQAAWTMPRQVQPTERVTRSLIALMQECDGVLACLPKHTLTIGTVMEVVYAASIEMPVVVHGDLSPSWALASLKSPVPVIADLNEAVHTLTRLMGDD